VSRLSYANVVATLALFVALGGSSYAALRLSGRDIRNHSITHVDLRKNTLTGREINESKLGRVPSARLAASATIADSANLAKNADNATNAAHALNASTADAAGLAKDAQSLAGMQASTFEHASRTAFGSAPASPAGAPTEKTVLSWPEAGMKITNASDASLGGGCAGGDLGIGVANSRSSGGAGIVTFVDRSGNSFQTSAGATSYQCANDSNAVTLTLLDTGSSRTMFVSCFRVTLPASAADVRCLGVRSEP
jgi:hypothetical protein